MPLHTTYHRVLAERYMPDSGAIYRPDYAGTGSPILVATVPCRVVTDTGGGANALDPTGEATHMLHFPSGTAVREGDEVLVNGSARYLVLVTNRGRSLAYDTLAFARLEA